MAATTTQAPTVLVGTSTVYMPDVDSIIVSTTYRNAFKEGYAEALGIAASLFTKFKLAKVTRRLGEGFETPVRHLNAVNLNVEYEADVSTRSDAAAISSSAKSLTASSITPKVVAKLAAANFPNAADIDVKTFNSAEKPQGTAASAGASQGTAAAGAATGASQGTAAASEDGGSSMGIVFAVVGGLAGVCCLGLCGYYMCSGSKASSAGGTGKTMTPTQTWSADGADDVAKIVEEGMGDTLTSTFRNTLPQHWTNNTTMQQFDQMIHVDTAEHRYFDELLESSYDAKVTQDRLCPTGKCGKTPGGCPCVQPGVGLPAGYRVRRVIRIEDSDMWDKYQKRLAQIKALREGESIHPMDPPAKTDEIADKCPRVFEPLDASVNELYLWHGTDVRAALSIAQDNFDIDLAGSGAGTMYGCGAYCAESSTKADEYAKDEPGGYYQGIYALLLCRVIMGKMYYTTSRDTSAGDKVATGDYDSTLGDRTKYTGTFREFVLYDANQVYPEYIVLYSRMGANDDPTAFDIAVKANPFHMELPVYWKNCHMNPCTSPFQIHYIVDTRARGKLQELARKCCSKKVVVKSAKRIESSSIWSKYVNFKRRLYVKLGDEAELGEASKKLVKMLGGREQVIAPGKSGFPLPRHIDKTPVLTRTMLENESASEALSTEYLDDNLNEHFLWHGTTKAIAETIVVEDFHIPGATKATHGARFGAGAYFAENLDKSLDYANLEKDGVQYILLCRVLGGSMYHTTEHWKEDAAAEANRLGHHSVLANPQGTGPREFIMLSEEQVYPEYIVEVKVSD
jgi:hypothetical protein